MRDHIKILGILNIVMGGFSALLGIGVMLFMGGLATFLASNVNDSSSDSSMIAPFLGLIGIAVAVFLIAISVPSIIGGWGLMKYKSWSRVVMIVVSALHLPNVPLGTAVGIYGLWVLLNDQSRQLLESGGVMPTQVFPMPQQPMGYPPPGA